MSKYGEVVRYYPVSGVFVYSVPKGYGRRKWHDFFTVFPDGSLMYVHRRPYGTTPYRKSDVCRVLGPCDEVYSYLKTSYHKPPPLTTATWCRKSELPPPTYRRFWKINYDLLLRLSQGKDQMSRILFDIVSEHVDLIDLLGV